MVEVNTKSIPNAVATAEYAIEYITNALTNEELRMKNACKKLGWSFPRIRSRALTIAKRLNCAIVKTSKGVYILEPLEIPIVSNTIVSNAIVDDPIVDDPIVDDPIVDDPIVDDPIVDDPIVDDPIVDYVDDPMAE